jgi:hypothetical protein
VFGEVHIYAADRERVRQKGVAGRGGRLDPRGLRLTVGEGEKPPPGGGERVHVPGAARADAADAPREHRHQTQPVQPRHDPPPHPPRRLARGAGLGEQPV